MGGLGSGEGGGAERAFRGGRDKRLQRGRGRSGWLLVVCDWAVRTRLTCPRIDAFEGIRAVVAGASIEQDILGPWLDHPSLWRRALTPLLKVVIPSGIHGCRPISLYLCHYTDKRRRQLWL